MIFQLEARLFRYYFIHNFPTNFLPVSDMLRLYIGLYAKSGAKLIFD